MGKKITLGRKSLVSKTNGEPGKDGKIKRKKESKLDGNWSSFHLNFNILNEL